MGDLEQRRDREVFREIGPGTVEEKVGKVGSWGRYSVASSTRFQRAGDV